MKVGFTLFFRRSGKGEKRIFCPREGEFLPRILHIVVAIADHGTTYGMRQVSASRKTAPDPPRRARHTSGKELYSPESGSGGSGVQLIAKSENKQAYR